MREWLWHLFNDPMKDNPWSLALLLLTVFGVPALVIGPSWWRSRKGEHDA